MIIAFLSALAALVPTCRADAGMVAQPAAAREGPPTVLSAQLAVLGIQLPFCEGTNDALPVTFSHPLADDPSTESFLVKIGEETVEPACATLDPANEDNERQTVLLLGQFQPANASVPMEVEIRSVSVTVNGSRVALEKDHSFSANLDAPAASIAVAQNQTLVDSAVLDLSADGNTADDDENGCAASFPGATYAIRLIFSSGVRDRDAAGALVPLGADPSAARANELFTLDSEAGDEIIGQADADGDNYADVCVRGAGGARGAVVLTVTCVEGAAVTAPDGVPCSTPIEVRLGASAAPGGAEPAAVEVAAPEAAPAPAPVQPPADSSGAGPLGPFAPQPTLAIVAAVGAELLADLLM